jgi:hypothetical protein
MVVAVRAVFATAFTAIPSLEMILLCKYNITLLG